MGKNNIVSNYEEIQKYKAQLDEIFLAKEKQLDEKLAQVESLIKKYTDVQDDETSRNSQIAHKNNDVPLARNRIIIEAEIKSHQQQYRETWDSNTDQANGKYTTAKKQEWLDKLAKLQQELKESPN